MSSVHLRLASRASSALRVDWNIVGRRAHVVSQLGNMSAGGAYIQTSVPAPEGARVQLQLLTDAGVVPTLARVVRSDPKGMGVRFEATDSLDVPFDVAIDEIDAD